MLYVTRFRVKESVLPADLSEVNRMIDTEVIPAGLQVEGVNSFEVHQSNNGELVAQLHIDDLATVDQILIDPVCRAAFGKFMALAVRTGGELLFDRPAWQTLYGDSE